LMDDWLPSEDGFEDFAFPLDQRTEELYDIPGAEPDENGVIECPVLVLKDLVVYPQMISPIFLSPGPNLLAVQEARFQNQTLVGLALKNKNDEHPAVTDFLPIGVELAVGRLLNLPKGDHSSLVQGRSRVEVVEFTQLAPYYRVKVRLIDEPTEVDQQTDALMRAIRYQFERVIHLNRSIPDEAYLFSLNINEPGWLADMVATAISPPLVERQALLMLPDPYERLKSVSGLLAKELDVLELEDEIQTQVQKEVDKSQREYYLREQMKAIQNELGEGDIWTREVNEFRKRIL
jgi:ATP-dependent Lon protease